MRRLSITKLALINSLLAVAVVSIPVKGAAQENQDKQAMELYVSGFATRSSPTGSEISFGDDNIPQAHFKARTGGGAKFGVFLPPYHGAFGIELEFFGHGGKITAPRTVGDGVTRFANHDLYIISAMLNSLVRYPGDFIQPYAGLGFGLALVGLDGESQTSAGQFQGDKHILGIGGQGIVGARLVLTKHVFLFTEYKYFLAHAGETQTCDEDSKKCGPSLQLDYQAHYATVGMGFRF